MTKNLVKFFIQLFVIVLLYYLFAEYGLSYLFAILAAVVFVAFIIFNQGKSRNKEIYLEVGCDAQRYLDTLEKLHRETDNQNVYRLSRAYGLIYKGQIDEARILFQDVHFDEIAKKEKYEPIYLRTKAKLAYEAGDQVTLKAMLDELALAEDPKEHYEITKDYLRILTLLLQERYEEAIAILVETIPAQHRRVHIVELEYYLAYAYYKDGRIEDAVAVTEFIVKKGYRVHYSDLCYELYEKIKY